MNRRIGWVAAGAIVMACVSKAWAGGVGPVLDDVRKGPPFPRIANCYGAKLGHWTKPETLEVLGQFDLLIGGVNAGGNDKQRQAVEAMVATLRKANGHLIVLDFSSSAPYAQPWHLQATKFPADGWLLTPDGKNVEGWPGSKMINLSRRSVIDWLARRSAASVEKPVFDGTFIDCMGGQFDHWACNIQSGQPYQIDADGDGQADSDRDLNRKWRQAKQLLARTVRTRIGPEAVFMANQAHQATFSQLNGILLEDFLDYVLDDGRSWRGVLDHYFHWTRTPHRPTVTTIVSSSGLEPAFNAWKNMTEADRDAICAKGKALTGRMRFGLATTLMGDGYFAYDLHTRWRGQHWWYPEYDAPLGYPTGPSREFPDGSWRRRFDGGIAVVNPTCLDLMVKTARRSRDVSSGKVDTELIVPAQDGRILVPTSDAATPGNLPDPSPAFTRTGARRMVRRDGRTLWRMDGRTCAVFRDDGVLLALYVDGREALRNVRAVISATPRWKDFKYGQARVGPAKNGTVEFRCRRTWKELAVDRRLRAAWSNGALRMTWNFTAATDMDLPVFRHQAELPVHVFAGGKATTESGKTDLPGDKPRGGPLMRAARKATFTSADGRTTITARSPAAMGLHDERIYRVDAFLLTQGGGLGKVKAGDTWKVELTIKPESR